MSALSGNDKLTVTQNVVENDWRKLWISEHRPNSLNMAALLVAQFEKGQQYYGTEQFQGDPMLHALHEWADMGNYLIALVMEREEIIDLLKACANNTSDHSLFLRIHKLIDELSPLPKESPCPG